MRMFGSAKFARIQSETRNFDSLYTNGFQIPTVHSDFSVASHPFTLRKITFCDQTSILVKAYLR